MSKVRAGGATPELFIRDQRFFITEESVTADPHDATQHEFQPAFMQAVIDEWKRLWPLEVKMGWLYTL